MNTKQKSPTYQEGVGWRYETEHRMTRRMADHDYQSRCIYMLTLTLDDRSKPLLGHLEWARPQMEAPQMEAPQPSCSERNPLNCSERNPLRASAPALDGEAPCSSLFPALPTPAPEQGACGSVGRLGASSSAELVPSTLGSHVAREWYALCEEYPQIKILHLQLMPEHLHVVLYVMERIPRHLGKLVGIVKNRCNKHFWRQLDEQGLLGPRDTESPPRLFARNFQDTILSHGGQLGTMLEYARQNPYRALVKRENADLFRVVAELKVGGETFAAIGNRWLLDRPVRMQVRCHNNTSPANLWLIARQKVYFLDRGEKGGVVVSPCISAGEKEIARAVLDAGKPLIVILENGFPPLYKPPGKYFEACAEGRLLMLAPWPYHMEQRTITRSQCNALNAMAAAISNEPWTPEMEAAMMAEM